MKPLDLILRDLIDRLDVSTQGLVNGDYEDLLRELEREANSRRMKIYDQRRHLHQQLAATSGA